LCAAVILRLALSFPCDSRYGPLYSRIRVIIPPCGKLQEDINPLLVSLRLAKYIRTDYFIM